MKKKSIIPLIAGFGFFILLFIFAEDFTKGIASGISNCFKIVIPSLFPFLIASSIAGYGELTPSAKKYIEPVTQKLFRLPAESLSAIILGQLGGYLSGAKALESLYSNGILTKNHSKRALYFSVNAGMGFAVNAIGSGLLFSRKAGRVLLASLCVSSLLMGFTSRFFFEDNETVNIKIKSSNPSISSVIVKSVKESSLEMLSACGFVVIFSGICEIFSAHIENETIRMMLTCIAEVTRGCVEIAGKLPLPVICAVCAFGGVCVHMQIFSLASNLDINIIEFYVFRFIHSASAYLICGLALKIYPVELPVSLSISPDIAFVSFSVPATISLMFLCVLLILDLDNARKV